MATVQFNLLPDTKLHNIKAAQSKKRIDTISTIVSVCSIALLLILFLTVKVVQKSQLSSDNNKITSLSSELQNNTQLNKVLTVQNQLTTLAGLHSNKHIMSNLFTYLSQLTPAKVSLSNVSLDTSTNKISILGSADSAATVNTFIDTLKFAQYKVGDSTTTSPAFSSVVESSFGISPSGATFLIDSIIDPRLFANNLTDSQGKHTVPTLVIKNQVTTRSVLNDPSGLFNGQGVAK